VFIDEIEKARATEFAAESLFALVDNCYRYKHQLVITSNLGVQRLKDHWDRLDGTYGKSIVRRLLDACAVIELR
jgi:DNA replication protein DnaC